MTTAPTPQDPRLEDLPAQRVAFALVKGAYSQFPAVTGQLFAWLATQGIEAGQTVGGTYYSNPQETAEADLEWEAWTTVADSTPERAPNADGQGVKTVPATRVAAVTYIGPYDQVSSAYGALFGWIANQRLRPVGPVQEVYLSDPETTPEAELQTELRVPVEG